MKAIINKYKVIEDRVKSETPNHFKKTRKYGLIAAGLGITLKIALAIFPATMPIGLTALAPELITIGLTVAGISQTAKK